MITRYHKTLAGILCIAIVTTDSVHYYISYDKSLDKIKFVSEWPFTHVFDFVFKDYKNGTFELLKCLAGDDLTTSNQRAEFYKRAFMRDIF